MNAKEYGKLVERMSPKSPMGMDCVKAFVIGGVWVLLLAVDDS